MLKICKIEGDCQKRNEMTGKVMLRLSVEFYRTLTQGVG